MHFRKHIGEAYSPPPQFTNSPDKFCLGNSDELPEGLAALTLVGQREKPSSAVCCQRICQLAFAVPTILVPRVKPIISSLLHS